MTKSPTLLALAAALLLASPAVAQYLPQQNQYDWRMMEQQNQQRAKQAQRNTQQQQRQRRQFEDEKFKSFPGGNTYSNPYAPRR